MAAIFDGSPSSSMYLLPDDCGVIKPMFYPGVHVEICHVYV